MASLLSGLGIDAASGVNLGQPDLSGLPSRVGGVDSSGLPGLASNIDFSGLPGRASSIDPSGLPSRVGSLDTSGLAPIASGIDASGIPQGVGSVDFSGLPVLPGANDFGDERRRVEQAQFDRSTGLLQPGFDRQRSQTDQALADRGFDLERSQGAQSELNRLDTQQNLARERLAADAIASGGAEQSRLFGLADRARSAGVNEQLAAGQFANQANAQGFNQALAGGQFANQARGQGISELLSNAALADQARSAGFNEQLTNAQLADQARAGGVNEQLAAGQFANQARGQGLTEQLANAGLADQARGAGLNEQLALRGLPLQDLAALGQVTPDLPILNPGNISPVNSAAPDVIGANLGANQQALQLAQLQNQRRGSFLGGITDLAGALGSAAILGSDRRLKSNIRKIGMRGNLNVYAWQWNEKARQAFGYKGRDHGFIAQEVRKIAPEAVVARPDGYLMIDYLKLPEAA